MKNSNASIIFAVALSLAITLFLTAAAADTGIIINCKGVPSMPVAAACAKVSSGSKPIADLCAKVLRSAAPASNETMVSVYAHQALEAAAASMDATYKLIKYQPTHHNESLIIIGVGRLAYMDCRRWYSKHAMVDVGTAEELMGRCIFEDAVSAVDAIDMCLMHDRRRRGGGLVMLPFYDRLLADRDMAVLASLLLGLAGDKTASSVGQ